MKVIGLIGTPHGKKGNTGRLLDLVLAGIESRRGETETIALKGGNVLPCRGRDTCHKKGACPQKDDFEKIKAKIHDAVGVVLTSPNYIFNVSAQLKAFMDRCCGVIHCLGFEGKYGASVVTSGGGDEAPIAEYMNHFLMTTGIVPVGAVWATMGAFGDDAFPEEIVTNARRLGEKLVTAWENCEKPAGVEEKMRAFSDRMRLLIAYRKEEWPYEYVYWRKYRGLDGDPFRGIGTGR